MMVHDYAYLLVFLGVIAEGELSVLASSFAAQKGLLNIYLVGIIAFLGTLIMDWGLFFSGKLAGEKIFEKFPKLQAQTSKPLLWLQRNPFWVLIVYRFFYGFRNIALLMMGMSHVSTKKFMAYSFVAILFWSVLFSFLGYFMGEMISHFIVRFETLAIYFITGLVCAALVMVLVRNIVRRTL